MRGGGGHIYQNKFRIEVLRLILQGGWEVCSVNETPKGGDCNKHVTVKNRKSTVDRSGFPLLACVIGLRI